MIACDFCDTVFSNKYTLNNHKKTAKYCLTIQGKKIPSDKKFQCDFCDKKLATNQSLQNHLKICQEKSDKTLYLKQHKLEMANQEEKYERKIQVLTDKIADLASQAIKRPTIKNNIANQNNIANLAPLDLDLILDRFSKIEMTTQDVIDGQVGLGRLLAPCLINEDGRKMIRCNDASRGIFSFIDDYGYLQKDYKLRKLASAVKPIAVTKAKEVYLKQLDRCEKFSLIDKHKCNIEESKEIINSLKSKLKDCSKYEHDELLEDIKIEEKDLECSSNELKRLQKETDDNYNLSFEYDNLEQISNGKFDIVIIDTETNGLFKAMTLFEF